ncbi:potassium-transporting ATPase subunit KdpC [Cellulomonas wangsupingiae]|uniref:Potassium-transporting ATPase KdpC subunit n=1 Tax=Cellulomonas wangsupingiae TaxID=2968085 RepID=A0ABY5K2X3_9CELL|nr:potassium-transporting ATPase subunit KdpC [Cellulomonas wangsupingiae]MCC2336080.1 potassium-transporting ATPase subunit KdpC [Cellulomonas wangsupingiae]UUI64802.1 potassium-transporting ATPase subunit KdpC [Cellulomonas wangsupingiae]
MSTTTRSVGRTLAVAARAMIVLTLVLGVGYTAVVTGVAQLVAPAQADGSLVAGPDGEVVGSALIGQSFTGADGEPLPQYFQPRPSAAGDGYDAGASSGSNLGPENPDLVAAIEDRRARVAALEGVDPADVPADAVTASASGLDPHISPAYAALQVARVADARGLDGETVTALVARHTGGRGLGFVGEPTVNVLRLNLALDDLEG